jgi:hypothetical protein
LLAQGDQSDQEEQLEPPIEMGRFQSHTPDKEVDPLIRTELAAVLTVFVEIKGR